MLRIYRLPLLWLRTRLWLLLVRSQLTTFEKPSRITHRVSHSSKIIIRLTRFGSSPITQTRHAKPIFNTLFCFCIEYTVIPTNLYFLIKFLRFSFYITIVFYFVMQILDFIDFLTPFID